MYRNTTFNSPYFLLTKDSLTISGKSIMENPYLFYQPVIQKLQKLQNDFFVLEIDIKSINAMSKKQLYLILLTLKENPNIKNIKVLWLSDPSDDEGFDMGKEFEMITGIPFEYLDYA